VKSPYSIIVSACSDRGEVRQINEDSWVSDEHSGFFAIADGMGGHGSGDIASKLVIDAMSKALRSIRAEQPDAEPTGSILAAIEQANSIVFERNRKTNRDPGSGMGTTLVGLYLQLEQQTCTVFNIGDSRLYRFRDSKLQQITEDHTLLRQWQLNDKRGPAPPGNIIMRAIGLFEKADCDTHTIDVSSGDLLLLCSDGLSDMLGDSDISTIISRHIDTSPKPLCEELVHSANRNGGLDNITAISIRFV
jgi:protein phosphatase